MDTLSKALLLTFLVVVASAAVILFIHADAAAAARACANKNGTPIVINGHWACLDNHAITELP